MEDPNLDFYLYDTPPMKIFKDKGLQSTFDDLEATPGAYFYFGVKDENLVKS